MLNAYDTLKNLLHASWIGQSAWLDRACLAVIDFFFGPLTGERTRFYWVFLVEALILLAIVHARRGGTLGGLPRFCFPRGTLNHRSTWVDWQVNIGNAIIGPSVKLFWRLSMPTMAIALSQAIASVVGPSPALLHWTVPALIVLTLLVAVGDDFGYYVFHRASHTIPALWAFHSVHHSAEVLTPLVAGRVHPVEMALSEPVRAATAALILGPALYFSADELNLVTVYGVSLTGLVFGALGNQLLHSQAPISFGPRWNRILVSPAVHQIHHSRATRHWDRNMGGLLSVWDWMFGTLVLPVPGEKLEYGIAENVPQPHPNLLAAYTRPFLDIASRTTHLVRLLVVRAQAARAQAARTRALRARTPQMDPLEP